jgi:hypothetical protein
MKPYIMESTPETSGIKEIEKTFICNFCKKEFEAYKKDTDFTRQIIFPEYDILYCENKPIKVCKKCSKNYWIEYLKAIPVKYKFMMYLVKRKDVYYITNWIGAFEKKVYIREGRHNITGIRRTFNFSIDNFNYTGTQYGYNSEIAHCYKLKH